MASVAITTVHASFDPERAPSGRDMAEALRSILESIWPAEQHTPPA